MSHPGAAARPESRPAHLLGVLVLASLLTLLLAGCGVAEAEHRRVVTERDSLKAALSSAERELDEFRNGAPRLLALAQAALDSGQFERARSEGQKLIERHPESAEAGKVRLILAAADRGIAASAAEAKRKREAAERAEKERLARALSGVFSERDDMRSLTFYYAKGASSYVNSRSTILLYIPKPDHGRPDLRFSIRYRADDWLFIERYMIKADDRTFTIDASDFNDVERDNGGGSIWEWYDVRAGSRELEIVRAVIASKNATIRYDGRQYYRDRTITAAEKRQLQAVLDAFEVLQRQS